MASNKAVAAMLGAFAESFPTREVTGKTAKVWMQIVAPLTDEQIGRATMRLCRDPDRRFFPTPGEVFGAVADEMRPIDTLEIIHKIERMGSYSPNLGWIYPTAEQVREVLGDAIADAYIIGGKDRVFSNSETTRDIARREMGAAVTRAQREQPMNMMLLSQAVPLLKAGDA